MANTMKRYTVYDTEGNAIFWSPNRWECERVIPPSEHHIYKIIETTTDTSPRRGVVVYGK